jgi:polyribonucleotide nucleotidyltransferase
LLAVIGASAALMPVGAFRGAARRGAVGYIDGRFVLNPTYQQLEKSELIWWRPARDAVLMIKGDANELPGRHGRGMRASPTNNDSRSWRCRTSCSAWPASRSAVYPTEARETLVSEVRSG